MRTLHARLRSETRPWHDWLQAGLDLPGRFGSTTEYRGLLAEFFGFYRPLETALASASWEGVGALFAPRRKTPLLQADLRALGLSDPEIARLPLCSWTPRPADRAGVFGCLYVLEGATLGGRVVRRYVLERLGYQAEAATMFFTSYGAQVGPMWQSFLDRMEVECRNDPDVVIRMAIATFESMSNWLFRERDPIEATQMAAPIPPSRAS